MTSKFFRIFFIATFVVLGACQIFAQNWPSFRGENASGVADNQNLPEKWNVETSENIKWKTPIPGMSHSSPVIWGGKIFVSTAVSADQNASFEAVIQGVGMSNDATNHRWELYCLDKTSGAVLWNQITHEGTPRTKRHIKGSQCNATPATDGRYVAAIMGSEGLFVYDLDGKLIWKKDLGLLDQGLFVDVSSNWGHASSPIIYQDMLIIQLDRRSDSKIVAFDIKNGNEIWSIARDEMYVWGTPVVHQNGGVTQLIASGGRYLRGYDIKNGSELWSFHDEAQVKTPSPVVANNLAYFSGGYPPGRPINAIKTSARGEVKMDGEDFVWQSGRGGPYTVTPLIVGDFLYSATDRGVVTCLDARTGEQIYRDRLSNAQSGSPVASDGKVYFMGVDGDIDVVKLGSEYEVLATNDMGEPVMSTPAISDGVMFIRAQRHLFAIGK